MDNDNKKISKSEFELSIVSFNLLSSEYFNSQVYKGSPPSMFDWNRRISYLKSIIQFLKRDIMCFQVLNIFIIFRKWIHTLNAGNQLYNHMVMIHIIFKDHILKLMVRVYAGRRNYSKDVELRRYIMMI